MTQLLEKEAKFK
jgi:hypothetical protein